MQFREICLLLCSTIINIFWLTVDPHSELLKKVPVKPKNTFLILMYFLTKLHNFTTLRMLLPTADGNITSQKDHEVDVFVLEYTLRFLLKCSQYYKYAKSPVYVHFELSSPFVHVGWIFRKRHSCLRPRRCRFRCRGVF